MKCSVYGYPFAASVLLWAAPVKAQQTEAVRDQDVPQEEQGFELEEVPTVTTNAPPSTNVVTEGAENAGMLRNPATPVTVPDTGSGAAQENASLSTSSTGVLAGVRLEGVMTHSIPLNRLKDTGIFRDSRPVGRLDLAMVVKGNMQKRDNTHCTATLIDEDVVMTAYHCFPGVPSSYRKKGYEARGATVTFGDYGDGGREQTFQVTKVIDADLELDFAILELGVPAGTTPPGQTYGYAAVALANPGDRQLRMFHHPYGSHKMVLQDATCRTFFPPRSRDDRLYHQCDTRGGSSGAAMLSYETAEAGGARRPVAYGIHISGRRKGLTNADRHFNVAVPLSEAVQKSPYLNKIGCQPVMGELECPDKTFARPFVAHFDFDRSTLSEAATAELKSLIDKISNPGPKVFVRGIKLRGFAEDIQGRSYAIGLGERRADAVRQLLVANGIPSDMISSVSMGSEGEPTGRNASSRRVEIEVDYRNLFN